MRPSRLLIAATAAAAALAAAPAVPTVSSALPSPDPGSLPSLPTSLCVADAADAVSLVTSQATVAPRLATTATGLDLLVVTDPLVPPGIPTALLATPAGWCSVEAFNLTPAAAGTLNATAAAFASVAAMPWLGEVTVRDLAVDGDTVTLTTFGGRHNVASAWTVQVDALGVRTARFETTAFGVGLDLDRTELEGVTSRVGHSRSWTRDAAGLLHIDATIADDLAASIATRDADAARAAEMVGLAPGDLLEHTFADGQTVRITYGLAPAVDTVETTVQQADRLRTLHAGLKPMYEGFMSWGVEDPWENTSRTLAGQGTFVPDDAGYVNIDSGLSFYCFACAFLTDAIEIHMALLRPEVHKATEGMNNYEDYDKFYVDVMGHELIHSLQGGYSDGAGGAFSNSLTEGQARAAEALFPGAGNTYAPTTRPYYDNANGCEGFENGRGGWIAASAAGPFLDGHTYDACYFWWTYYAEQGPEQLVRLWEQMPAALADRAGQNAASLNLELLDLAAPDGDGTLAIARWAAAFTAGTSADGYTITGGDGVDRDWYALLPIGFRSESLNLGSLDGTVADGGAHGILLKRTGTITTLPVGAEAFLYDIVDGALTLVGPVTVGAPVEKGQILSVVAPTTGRFPGQVTIS